MENSLLKKEFKKRDVERLRNLVKGKYGEKTISGVGYLKKKEYHNEGDVWEENGKKWTIINNVKQNITKLDKIKKIKVPLFCPSCSRPMNKPFDKDYFNVHRKCFDCVVEFETELRRIGAWEEYHKNIHNSEIDNFIVKYKLWVEEELNKSNKSFITENGDIENWVGNLDKTKVLNSLNETIKYIESLKK
jgi:hypothetical protein